MHEFSSYLKNLMIVTVTFFTLRTIEGRLTLHILINAKYICHSVQ